MAKKLPITQITTTDGLRYSGVVKENMIAQSNAKEVLDTFKKMFKEGDVVDVIIKKR